MVFNLFTFTEKGVRLKPYTTSETYPLLETDTTNVSAIVLERQEHHVLLSTLQRFFQTKDSRLTLRVNVTAVDVETGSAVALRQYYDRHTVVFGCSFRIVGFWNNDNQSTPFWDNFDRVVPDPDANLAAFLRLPKKPPSVGDVPAKSDAPADTDPWAKGANT